MLQRGTVGRKVTTMGALGLAIVLVGGIGVADAATGGNFILGQLNKASTTTTLKNTDGVPLSLVAPNGKPALKVNTGAKVANLNADKLDGLNSTQLQRKIHAPTWHLLAPDNGWVNYEVSDYGTDLQYTKDVLGFVHLRGAVNGDAQTSDVIATLPAGFRPAAGVWVPVGNSNGAYDPSPVNVLIGTNGDIEFLPNGGSNPDLLVSLEGVTFYVG